MKTKKVIESYYGALSSNHYQGIRELLASDFCFRDPMESYDSVDDYLDSLKAMEISEFFEGKPKFLAKVFGEEDAVILYEAKTRASARKMRFAESFRLKDNKITEIRLVFDSRILLQSMLCQTA